MVTRAIFSEDKSQDEENDKQIEQAAEKAEIIVLAHGKAHETNLFNII